MADRTLNDDMNSMAGDLTAPDTNNQTGSMLEQDYDDGLVHDHGWACSERGAPAR